MSADAIVARLRDRTPTINDPVDAFELGIILGGLFGVSGTAWGVHPAVTVVAIVAGVATVRLSDRGDAA